MARIECPREADVLTMVQTGRWPERMPDELRAHVAECDVCADVAAVSAALETERELDRSVAPARLPGSGTVWWRAQIRARQDAAKQVVRPISVAHALAFAGFVGLAGAVFGARADWFQHMLDRAGTLFANAAGGWHLPSLPRLSIDLAGNYSAAIVMVGLGIAATTAIVIWALREE